MVRILFKRHLSYEVWANRHFQFSFLSAIYSFALTRYTKCGTPSITLATDIGAAILGDALSNHLALFDLAVNPLALWEKQRKRISVHFLFPPSVHV